MKKFKVFTSLGLSIAILGMGGQTFAAEKNFVEMDKTTIESFSSNEMPDEVKEVFLNVPLQKDNAVQIQKTPEITPFATTAIPGNSTQDTTYSNSFGKDALNQIFTSVDKNGFWEGMAFNQFSGHGYTLYSGSQTPVAGSIKATTSVTAYGLIPSISINGSNWSILSTSKQLSNDSNLKGKKYAYAKYSNVKLQNITGLNAIFKNKAYVKVPSGMNDTWEENTYVWF